MSTADLRLNSLHQRVQEIPESLRSTAQLLREQGSQVDELARDIQRYDVEVAGIGGSLLPAEYLRNQLDVLGYSARQREASFFLEKQEPNKKKKILIVFSQSLSPNARLALTHRAYYEKIYVVCASAKARKLVQGVQYLRSLHHAPLNEEGGLVRIQGPINACLVVRAIIQSIAQGDSKAESSELLPASLSAIYRSPYPGPKLDNILAFLAPAQHLYAAQSFAWRLQECMQCPMPPAYDFLAFAHGPLQANYNRSGRFLYFETETTPIAWRNRIASALNPKLHELTFVKSTGSHEHALFEWDWLLWPSIFKAMMSAGVNPDCWAGQNKDASLYELGSTEPVFQETELTETLEL